MEQEAITFISEQCGYLFWIPLLPLLGFLANGLGWILARERWPRPVVNLIAVGSVAVSFVLSAAAFLGLRGLPEGHYYVFELSRKVLENNSEILKPIYWISAGGLDLSFKLVFDRLSAVMCLVVTGVGGLIHLYSTGYMAHDKSFARYFAYLNLFTFAMLTLVMGGNLVLMFVGWEGVGLCSYLLIGFWFEDDEKASAGKKAFIVNRIGDFGFLIGIFILFLFMKTLDFYGMQDWLTAGNHRDLLKDPGYGACPWPPSSGWPCSWGPAASRRRSRSSSGCPTPWPARPRSPPSSTPRPWSPPAST